MKFNFRKITSVLASALMLGSTAGFAAAAMNYPAPFVQGGNSDVALVIGGSAARSDYLAAIRLGESLQAELAKQTATTGSGSGASATGENINLATSSQKLYFNSSLNAARSTISKSELKTLLADGTVTDDSGTTYTYQQSISPGGRLIAFSRGGNSNLNDPELIIDAGTTSENYLYQYVLTFNKNINLSHADVQGNDINIFGTKFTIGANSGPTILYLYGTGDSVTLKEGESKTVTVGGKEYTIEVTAITQSTTDRVHVSVDGSDPREIVEGSSSKVGGLEIYAKNVIYSGKETTINSATLNIGSKTLKMENGQSVKVGAQEDNIQNTRVQISTSSNLVSAVRVNVSLQTSSKDYIKVGESYTDPIFGNLKLQFAGATPSLDDAARDKVSVFTGSLRGSATFTTALESKEYTFDFSKDQDTSDSTVTPRLATSGNKTIHVVENATIKNQEYAMINSGDYGRIVQITTTGDSGALSSSSKIQLTDAISGKDLLGSGLTVATGSATTNIDGQPYYFFVPPTDNNTVQITWGGSSGYANPGTATTLFPRIKLKGGGWVAVVARATLTNATTYSMPGAETLATYESGTSVVWTAVTGPTSYMSVKIGNVNYTIRVDAASNTTGYIEGVGVKDATGYVPVNSSGSTPYGPGILYLEEKKSTESGNADNGDYIMIGTDASGTTTPVEISVTKPSISGISSGEQSLGSESTKSRWVTRYGTLVEHDSTGNDKTTLWAPADQMYVDVLFTEALSTVSAGSGGGTGTVAELGLPAVTDAEVSSVSDKNLIVLGGSCVNKAAAKMLGSETPLCGSAFTDGGGVGSDQFLIKVMESPYSATKIAMLVAGYEAADTERAVTFVRTEKPATDKGTVIKKVTQTFADVA